MRLLNTKTLKLESFLDGDKPKYAILSHTWGAEEVLFEDLRDGRSLLQCCDGSKQQGLSKVLKSAEQARRDRLRYIWIDTCCIDKSSSAELSEAINSMFAWYQNSEICYAFIEDYAHGRDKLSLARWFTRGWTLQELIAPRKLHFFDADWTEFGDRVELCIEVAKITGIDARVLHRHYTKACAMREIKPVGKAEPKEPKMVIPSLVRFDSKHCECPLNIQAILEQYSIAEKMTWAESRETCRPEDIAYSLLGLFNVNMPLLYGEGMLRSFTRLQEEIARHTNDQTILLWWEGHQYMVNQDSPVKERRGEAFSTDEDEREDPMWTYQHYRLFAEEPCAFKSGRFFRPLPALRDSSDSKGFDLAYSNAGLHLKLHIAPCQCPDTGSTHIAVLNCGDVRDDFVRAGLLLRKTQTAQNSFCPSGRPPVRVVHGSSVVRGSPRSWHKLPNAHASEDWCDLQFDPAELTRTYIILEDYRKFSMPGVGIPTAEFRFPTGKAGYSILAIAPDPATTKLIYRSPATLPVQACLLENTTFIYGALSMYRGKDAFFILWGRQVDIEPGEVSSTDLLRRVNTYPPKGQPDVYIFHGGPDLAGVRAEHIWDAAHYRGEHGDDDDESGGRAWICRLVEMAEQRGSASDDLRTPGMAFGRWETRERNRVTVKAWMENVEFLGREKTYINVEIAVRDGWEVESLEKARTLERARSRGL